MMWCHMYTVEYCITNACEIQCCGAATLLGGSGSGSPRYRSRPSWVSSGSNHNRTAPAPVTNFSSSYCFTYCWTCTNDFEKVMRQHFCWFPSGVKVQIGTKQLRDFKHFIHPLTKNFFYSYCTYNVQRHFPTVLRKMLNIIPIST